MRRTAMIAMTVAILLAAVTAAAAPTLAQAKEQYGPDGGAVEETDLVAELALECPDGAQRVVGYRLSSPPASSR
jgi:hypothetical protein